MENILIPNQEELEKKKQALKKDGKENIFILTSFDKTLTKATYNGKKVISFISKLRNGKYISKDYAEKAQRLYEKYHPIEISPNLSLEEKSKNMLEWWKAHYELLIKCGLDKKTLYNIAKDMVNDGDIKAREHIRDFFDILECKLIPIIIMSSSGIGNTVIEFLDLYGLMRDNVHFIGNILEFDKEGKFTGMKNNKIIHTFNKNESGIRHLSIYENLKKRQSIILLCDSIADLNMLEGFKYKNIIKIGFLNEDIEKNLEDFKKNFDIIILNDSDFGPINDLLKDIL